ncbi:MAG: hypothetical protein HY363_00215 [Candidatus Aenigmarchaeota archaeon]|nr:hypothetical protein [Candidatus Aenigmarchaeota archaeon]
MPHVGYSLDVGAELNKQVETKERHKQESGLLPESPTSSELRPSRVSAVVKYFSDFFLKYNAWIIIFLLAIITFQSLSRTADIPVIDERARDLVANQFRFQITSDVNRNFPILGYDEKLAMINRRVYEAMQSEAFGVAVGDVVQKYKSWYRDETGSTYLYTPDSYYWFRLSRNLLENGHLGSELNREGVVFDSLRFAPAGDWPQFSVAPYALFYFYKIWRFFDSGVLLEVSSFYFPVFFGILSVCVVFLIARKFAGNLAGFFAGFVLAVHPLFILFNYGGYVDTQVVVFFLSCLILFVSLFFVDWKRPVFAVGAVLVFVPLLWVLRRTWAGWYFIVVVLVMGVIAWLAIFLVHKIIEKRKWQYYVGLAIVLVFFAYLVFWFTSSIFFEETLKRLGAGEDSLFPTGFKSVLELRGISSPKRFVSVLGGFLPVLVFVFAISYKLYRNICQAPKIQELMLISWAVLLLVPGVGAIRFMYLFLPPFVVFIGLGCNGIVSRAPEFLRRFHFGWSDGVAKICAMVFLFLFFAFFITADVLTQSSSFPVGNDGMSDAADWFKKNTLPDAVIATWWDLGYFWESDARRATLFDGGLFTTHYLYWMSKVLASDASEIVRIFHPVACNQPFWLINVGGSDFNKRLKAVEQFLLAPIAGKFDNHVFDQFDTHVSGIEALYCKNPRDVYLVTTKDMLYKIGLYRDYSAWDFETARFKHELKNLSRVASIDYLADKYGMSEEEASSMLFRVYEQDVFSPAPVQMSRLSQCKTVGGKLVCDNKFEVNITAMDARQNKMHPKSLVVVKDGSRSQVFYNDSIANFAVVIFDDGEEWRSLLMDVDVADMLVVRMFTGEDMPFLKKVHQTKETPDRVIAYKVLFDNGSAGSLAKNVTLTPLSAELFFWDLLINVSKGDNDLFMRTVQAHVPLNLSLIFEKQGVQKAFMNVSHHTNITVQYLADELQRNMGETAGSQSIKAGSSV